MTTITDWSRAPKWAQYYAIDSNGQGHWMTRPPYAVDGERLGYWSFHSGSSCYGFRHELNGVDWHTLLEQRPEAQP